MAFFLTPRFAPAYQQCGPFSCAPARASRPSVPSFVPFVSQVEELLSEIDREARRAEHAKRQQRKRLFRARFDVRENNEGYQVEGEVPGFEQENISVEITNDYTLKVAGNTAQKLEQSQAASTQEVEDKMDGVTLNEPEAPRAASPAISETKSHKSYQPTIEDDFEDLGAETSSTISTSEPQESKGKERAVEATEAVAQQQPPQEVKAQVEPANREWLSERVHGSFERNFQFPERIDATGVRASLKNGVLAISVPKAPVPSVRQITIQ